MLSKNKIKHIASLQQKKFRDLNRQFVVEGYKMTDELLRSDLRVVSLIVTPDLNHKFTDTMKVGEVFQAGEEEIMKVSSLKTPQGVLAVAEMPHYTIDKGNLINQLSLCLDDIQDPGNLGTIIRIADWFGIRDIFCSENSVDVFNPKVVQATMGAIFRVNVHYVHLADFLKEYSKEKNFPIYGTLLDGDNMYHQTLSSNGFIVMGNESKGISPELKPYINQKLYIPNYPPDLKTSESLNVSTATAIVCAEFRRRML